MKKSLSFILALVMVLSVSTTAFAGIIKEDSTQQSDSTEIKYNVDPTYTVTIPSNVTLGEKATVKVENTILKLGDEVKVKLTGTSGTDNAFLVKTPQDAELAYTVKNGNTVINVGDTVISCASLVNDEVELLFTAPTSVQYAGEYTGTVTFTVSVE
ncbi:MAG: hypothetical protein MR274_07550 [Clostridium sp.]|nr:hypothetical protein [Clostridium sp.]